MAIFVDYAFITGNFKTMRKNFRFLVNRFYKILIRLSSIYCKYQNKHHNLFKKNF